MKLFHSLVVAAIVAIPAVSFAQTNAPVTRAAVRAELVQLRAAGYNPASDRNQYPDHIQAALAHLSAASAVAATSYGSSTDGTSASGSRATAPDSVAFGDVYAHH
jgi:hypothetical protein